MVSSRSRFLTAAAVLVATSVVVLGWFWHARGPSPADGPEAHDASMGRALPSPPPLATLEKSLQAIEEGERESPRDRWDPAYIVEQVGRDPRRLQAWVHDHTYWVPYHGVLRGPVGVLMDRQGNSFDRAALLAKLLKTAGYETRLAHGELSARTAGRLLPGLAFMRHTAFADSRVQSPADVLTRISTSKAERTAKGGTVTGTDAEMSALASHYARIATPVVTKLDTRVSGQKRRLLAMVRAPDVHDERVQRARFAIESLRDHWWVQWQDGTTWRDLDLLAPRTRPALTKPKETRALPEIEQTSFHRVAVRVIAEYAKAGSRTERTVLENTFWPAALLEKPIVLQLWPTHWPQDVAPDPNSPYGLRAAALDQHEWSATLQFGSEVVAQGIVTDDNEPTAVWLEYETLIPGMPARKVRRAVFELPGPATDDTARLTRSLALMMRTEILPLPCALSPQFVTHVIAQNLRSSGDLLRTISRKQFDLQAEAVQKAMDRAPPPLSTLYTLGLMRTAWSRTAGDVYIDRPALLTRHRFLKPAEHGVVLEDAIDIVTNEVGVDLAVRDAFPVRMEQGLFDSNAESLLQGSAAVASTSDAFATTRNWLTLKTAQKSEVAKLSLPARAQARITADLDAGYTVVAPKETTRLGEREYTGWWRVDPRTGDALGILDNGWGASTSEYSVLLNVMIAGARGFWFDALMCHGAPIAMNELLAARSWLHENVGKPSWTREVGKYESLDDLDIIMSNLHRCVWQGLIVGAVSALPVLLLQSRLGLLATSEGVAAEDVAANSSRPPSRPPPPSEPPLRGPSDPTLPSAPDAPGVNPKPQGEPPLSDPTAPGEAPPGRRPPGGDTQPSPGNTAPEKPSAPESAPPDSAPRDSTPPSDPGSKPPGPLTEIPDGEPNAEDKLRDMMNRNRNGNLENTFDDPEYNAFQDQWNRDMQNKLYGDEPPSDDDLLNGLGREAPPRQNPGTVIDPYADEPSADDLLDGLLPDRPPPTQRAPQPAAGVSASSPASDPLPPGNGPVTQDDPERITNVDLGDTMPGGRPPPIYAPVRNGPPDANPRAPGDVSARTFIGLGGLDPPP